MTKEIGALLTEGEVKISSPTTSTKKEGTSLFDSLLKDASAEVKSEQSNSKEIENKTETTSKETSNSKTK